MFGLILAGTDGSERAQEAVRRAAQLASVAGVTLDLAYVIDTKRPHDVEVEPKAESALQRAEAIASKEGVTATTKVLAGAPGEGLMTFTSHHHAAGWSRRADQTFTDGGPVRGGTFRPVAGSTPRLR